MMYVTSGPNDNELQMGRAMAWHQEGDKPLP